MRKFYSILSVLLCAGFGANAAVGDEFVVDGLTYVVTGDKTVGVSDDGNKTGEIIIPESVTASGGVIYTVTSIESGAFTYSDATKIVLPNTVTEIKKTGIYTTEASEIVLSENLKTIGSFGLAYNKNLKSAVIPAGVTVIPESLFAGCTSLTSVTLHDGITEMGSGAFYKSPLTEFTFPKNVKKVGNNIFQGASLRKVVLNAALEEVGEGTLRNCVNLTDVNLGDCVNLKNIGDNMFVECNSLANITIPEKVATIGLNAFGNTAIVEYKVAVGNKNFKVEDGVVFSADGRLLYLFPPKKDAESYTVKDGVVGISAGAFYGSQIKKITLPESGFIALDSYVFVDSKLEEINLPNTITYIGEQAFAGTQLKTLVLPEKLTFVSDGLAAWSKSLTTVTIPADVRTVYNHAFQTCSALTDVYCKSGVAPYLYDWYSDEDSPFGYIDKSNITLHIPAGSLKSYKENGWNDVVGNIVESEPAAFVQTVTNPATGVELSELGAIEITFAEEATVVNSNPEVTVRKDSELAGDFVEAEDGWMAVNNSKDKKTVTVFPKDMDAAVAPIKLESEVIYYVSIPAGTFKNAAGVLNQKIVLELVGEKFVVPFNPTSINPSTGSGISEISNIELTFESEINSASRNPIVTLKKSDAETGESIEPENGWMSRVYDDKKTVTVFPVDYDLALVPVKLEDGITYYLTIPAGTFTSVDGNVNEDIDISYVGIKEGGVDGIGAAAIKVVRIGDNIAGSLEDVKDASVYLYDAAGRLLSSNADIDGSVVFTVDGSGLYIVRVAVDGNNYTFKVVK